MLIAKFNCRPIAWLVAALTCITALPFAGGTVSAEPWESQLIRLQKEIEGEEPPVITALAVHPNGRFLAVAGDDHLIRIWDLKSDLLVGRLAGHRDWVRAIAFSPDGTLASGGDDHRILIWQIDSPKPVAELPKFAEAISTIEFDANGKVLAVAGFQSRASLYDLATRRQIKTIRCGCQDIRTIAFSPDAASLAMAGRNGKIEIYDVGSGQRVFSQKLHSRRVRAVEFAKGGSELISTGEDRRLLVLDVANQKVAHRWNTGGAKMLSLAILPDGIVATGGSDNTIRLWSADSGSPLGQLRGHTGSVCVLCESEGRLISGSYDTTVRVWSNPGGKLQRSPLAIPAETPLQNREDKQAINFVDAPQPSLSTAKPGIGLNSVESVEPIANPNLLPSAPITAPATTGRWESPTTSNPLKPTVPPRYQSNETSSWQAVPSDKSTPRVAEKVEGKSWLQDWKPPVSASEEEEEE